MRAVLVAALLMLAPELAQALTIPEALSAATGWPMPGRDGTWRADDLRGKVPGGFHHGSGLGYVQKNDPPRHDEPHDDHDLPRHEHPKHPECPPAVPIPAAIWLFATSIAGMAMFGRRT